MSHRSDYWYDGPTSGVSSYFRSHYGYGRRYGSGRRFRSRRVYVTRDRCNDYDSGYYW